MTDLQAAGPIWRSIEQALNGEIAAGVWAPGAQLPSETDLAKRFSVNRHTVRRAMSELSNQGIIRIEHGRGSFVQENVIHYAVSSRTRVEQNLASLHRNYSGRLLSDFTMPSSSEVATALQIPVGEPVVVMDTLNESDNVPLSLVRTYLQASAFAGFPAAYAKAGNSMTGAFAACGISDFSRLSTDIGARMPTQEEAGLLKQPSVQPILVSSTVDIDPNGRRIKYGIARFPAGRVTLTIENLLSVPRPL